MVILQAVPANPMKRSKRIDFFNIRNIYVLIFRYS